MKIESPEKDVRHFKNNNVVKCVIDGVVCFVPEDEDNRHYKEIKKQEVEGKISVKIKDKDIIESAEVVADVVEL